MDDPTLQAAIDATALAEAAKPTNDGASARFDNLVKEMGIEVPEEGITLKQTEEVAPQTRTVAKEPEQKKEPEKPAKDAVPDFGKKPEKIETKVEPNHDEELKQHPAVKGEAAKSFKSILQQRDEVKAQLAAKEAEFQSKLKELEGRTGKPPKEVEEKLTALEKALQERDEMLGRSNFENSPKIKAYNNQAKLQLDAAKSYLDGDDTQQAAVDTAANLTGQKRLKALVDSGMNAETLSAVAAHLARVDDIRAQKNGELENWKVSAQSYEQEQKAAQLRADTERKAFEENVFKTVLDKMVPELEGLQKVDGYEDWNKGADDSVTKIKRLYNGDADLGELAEVIARGVAQPAEKKLRMNLQAKYDALVEEMQSLKGITKPKGDVRTGGDKTAQETGSPASRFDSTHASIRGS